MDEMKWDLQVFDNGKCEVGITVDVIWVNMNYDYNDYDIWMKWSGIYKLLISSIQLLMSYEW
jgi:hypothetical protein